MLDAPLTANVVKPAVLTTEIIQMLRIMDNLEQPALAIAQPAYPLLLPTPVVLIKIVSKVKTRKTNRMMISVFA